MNDTGKYNDIILATFKQYYQSGTLHFEFTRSELKKILRQLNIKLTENIGNVIDYFRFRSPLPKQISDTAPQGAEWLIEPTEQGNYRFRLGQIKQINSGKLLVQ